ncbi:hypothetical protein TYRP_008436 [Tyrophagus putrescentiae]|nr:hypothetical protein TYRP_008436 [Tyrophagus putrescentiae]
MNSKLIALFVLSALLMATFSIDSVEAGSNKGGDILVLGGAGGGGSLIKSNGKKGGSTIYLGGRRRRSVAVQQPVFTIYRTVEGGEEA